MRHSQNNIKTLQRYYHDMLLIRRFEEKVLSFFDVSNKNKIFGTTHVYIGQEAVAVGVCSKLRQNDFITSTHRGHGHFLAKGGDPARIMAELFGKVTGYSKGKGGTQHMGDLSIGHLGSNGITGGGLPIATGAGFSIQYQKQDQVVVCFFGDGAANEGMFHESLNMAAIWSLPIIFICENNLYAMSTPIKNSFSVPDIATRACAYGIEGVIVDGMCVLDVAAKTEAAVEKARGGGGPTLLECKTYRFLGHSKNDLCAYRTREEESEWRKKDPLVQMETCLHHEGMSLQEFTAISNEVNQTIEDAVRFADDSPWPSSQELFTDLYC
ncbi:MAG: thiamine pyrophosphate-dependent dehydrogenase E1 component subunit alpha [Oligoflexia bacterium]|nr:thiamine pyrophosphate-dependent dehydrogenase E1 component subunit alpha [Oligoflexia bacterium]